MLKKNQSWILYHWLFWSPKGIKRLQEKVFDKGWSSLPCQALKLTCQNRKEYLLSIYYLLVLYKEHCLRSIWNVTYYYYVILFVCARSSYSICSVIVSFIEHQSPTPCFTKENTDEKKDFTLTKPRPSYHTGRRTDILKDRAA